MRSSSGKAAQILPCWRGARPGCFRTDHSLFSEGAARRLFHRRSSWRRVGPGRAPPAHPKAPYRNDGARPPAERDAAAGEGGSARRSPRTPPSALCCRKPEPRRLARRLHRLRRARPSWSAVELVRYVKNYGDARDPGNLRRAAALGGDMDPLENNHKQRRWLIAAIVVVVGVLIAL